MEYWRDRNIYFVKRLVKNKTVVCPHVATREMVADIFTKDLPDELFGGHSVTVLGRSHRDELADELASPSGVSKSLEYVPESETA